MKQLATKSISALIIMLIPLTGFSGTISPRLEDKINNLDKTDRVPVVIILKDSDQDHSLKSNLIDNYSTRAERHRAGILTLKDRASVSQVNFIDYLQNLEQSGLAGDIKSHWIINVVTANLAVSELEKTASLNDIEVIHETPVIRTIAPVDGDIILPDVSKSIHGVEENVKMIGADSAWKLGYTGEGRIVCSFDTGIEGNHPALYNNWKGHDGDPAAAWFDPVDNESFPHTFSGDINRYFHGTHVMGTMVGHDDSSDKGDTIGVAPGARWISAAVLDIAGASIIDAFEWAADPDGDPNTISDVPDVINHSWGDTLLECNDYFWNMIDNTEALGIVNVFAAGNRGVPSSIDNPANRALTDIDCFAVGALDTVWTTGDTSLATFSAQGPSDCNGAIKPNITAPGVFIRSSYPPNTYLWKQGASMATPHVSGAVAILRQAAPDATVDEIKQAIIDGARPLGGTSPNNSYGWGMLYIPGALEALAPVSSPRLSVYSYDFGTVSPGGSIGADVIIQNRGGTLNDIYGLVSGGDGVVSYTVDSLYFGALGLMETGAGHIEFEATVSDTITTGSLIGLDFALHGSGGYLRETELFIMVGEKQTKGYFTHATDAVQFTISNYGAYGFGPLSFMPLGGVGFIVNGYNTLYEASLLLATDADHVSDGLRNVAIKPDNDFAVAPGGNLIAHDPGDRANQETVSIFNDSRAENPIGLQVTQKTYSWTHPPDEKYVILEFILDNISGGTINNLYAGLYLNWDANDWIIYNTAGYSAAEKLGYIYYSGSGGTQTIDYRGQTVINDEGVVSYSIEREGKIGDDWFWMDYLESEKYDALTRGIETDTLAGYDSLDLAHILTTGPFILGAGESDTAVFAILAAASLPDLQTAALRAKENFDATTAVEEIDTDIIPDKFTLYQNYPNPFNPSTVISFSLPSKSSINLSIYNLLGRKVIDLIDRELSAGTYNIVWDGADIAGRPVAAGVYFYRLKSGQIELTRKMILLK